MLLPNTGDEATEDGKTWGFHGEAGLRAWRSDRYDAGLARARPRSRHSATRCPPCISRRWAGPDRRNDRPQRLVTIGRVPVGRTPDVRRGVRTRRDPARSTPDVPRRDGRQRDRRQRRRHVPWPGRAELGDASLDHIPARSPRRFLFGFLDGVREGTYRLRNDRLGLAARLSWPREVFPVVWLWEEIRFTDDPPWNGQAYAVGIEPHVAYPAVGMTELRRRGGHGLTLEPDASLAGTVTLSVERIDVGREVTDARALGSRQARARAAPGERQRPGTIEESDRRSRVPRLATSA